MAQVLNAETGQAVIIGWGVAAVNAAIALRGAGWEGPVRVCSAQERPPVSPVLMSDLAAGTRSEEACRPWPAALLDSLAVDVLAECPATRLDVAARAVDTPQGTLRYDACLVASGASPVRAGAPQVEGEPGFEPLVLRTVRDAQRLADALSEPGAHVLVSGGSMVALKVLDACLQRGAECTLVARAPQLFGARALPVTAERFQRALASRGAGLRLGCAIARVQRVDEGPGARYLVTFDDGTCERVSHLALAHGMEPNLGFLAPGALERDRGLLVDGWARTSDPRVFAAGDVAQGLDLSSGRQRIVGTWKNAALTGAAAGRAMAAVLSGEPLQDAWRLPGAMPANTVSAAGALFICAGSVELAGGRWAEVREHDGMTVASVFEPASDGSARLAGFNVAADADEPGGAAYDAGAMLTRRLLADV